MVIVDWKLFPVISASTLHICPLAPPLPPDPTPRLALCFWASQGSRGCQGWDSCQANDLITVGEQMLHLLLELAKVRRLSSPLGDQRSLRCLAPCQRNILVCRVSSSSLGFPVTRTHLRADSGFSGWHLLSISLCLLSTAIPLLKLGNPLCSYLVDLSEGEQLDVRITQIQSQLY